MQAGWKHSGPDGYGSAIPCHPPFQLAHASSWWSDPSTTRCGPPWMCSPPQVWKCMNCRCGPCHLAAFSWTFRQWGHACTGTSRMSSCRTLSRRPRSARPPRQTIGCTRAARLRGTHQKGTRITCVLILMTPLLRRIPKPARSALSPRICRLDPSDVMPGTRSNAATTLQKQYP